MVHSLQLLIPDVKLGRINDIFCCLICAYYYYLKLKYLKNWPRYFENHIVARYHLFSKQGYIEYLNQMLFLSTRSNNCESRQLLARATWRLRRNWSLPRHWVRSMWAVRMSYNSHSSISIFRRQLSKIFSYDSAVFLQSFAAMLNSLSCSQSLSFITKGERDGQGEDCG